MKKSDVLELLKDMPEELDAEKLIYTLYVRRKVELGLAALDAGEETPDEEVAEETQP